MLIISDIVRCIKLYIKCVSCKVLTIYDERTFDISGFLFFFPFIY